MICEKCGHKNQVRTTKDPWWMYQFDGTEVKSALFDPDNIPDGWYGSGKEAKEAFNEKSPKAKKASSKGLNV